MSATSLRNILKAATRPRYSARLARERERESDVGLESGEGVKFEQTISINAPVPKVFAMWRNLENLPRFMQHVVSVTQKDEKTSHWEACSPDGERIQWNARIIEEKPDELIAWESLPEADLKSAGSVRVSPAPDGGTVLKVALKYAPAGGQLKKLFARIFTSSVEQRIQDDLVRFKQLVETDDTLAALGQPAQR